MKFKPMLLSAALTILISGMAQAQAPVHETPQPEAPAVVGKHHAAKPVAKSASKKKHKAAKKSAAKSAKKGKKKPAKSAKSAKHTQQAKQAKHTVH
ncbi:MAG TPA: hypothetical protein VGM81_20645 [Burkholderiaceae bacterium]|jgi:hypothetical protein